MSKKRRYALLLAVVLMASALSLPGCSSSGSSTADTNQSASVAKGVVTVSATFPGTGGAVKSLIPTATQAIYVKFNLQGSQATGSPYDLKLTAASPTGTIKLAPGNYIVNALAYDSATETSGYPTGRMLAQTSSGGVVQLGSNTVNLTFLNGIWTVVDSAGTPTPLVLSTGLQLNDMVIGGDLQGMLAKSAFDFSKPIGGGSGLMRYRFDSYTSARTIGSMMSQFIGTQNSFALSSNGPYNLTQKCTSSSYDAQITKPCEEKSGDQMVMVSGIDQSSGSYSSGGAYQGDFLYGYASALLPNQGQTSFTQNGTPINLMSQLGTSTISGGTTITGSLVEIIVSNASKSLVTTPSPAKLATAKAIKAQSTNTPYTGITATDYNLRLCATTATPNVGTWQFYGQPETIGSATCYNNGYLSNYGQTGPITPNAGDFSYGLAPTDPNNLGDYCHQWDYNSTSPTYNTCQQQKPGSGEVYMPGNFIAKKSTTKTTIDYGSFKVNFHIEKTMSGTIYVYPFTAKGKAN